MAIARRQVVTTLSVLYLTALTALAAYALHSSHAYSLPIPDIICALTVALPPLAGVALSVTQTLNERLSSKRRGNIQQQKQQQQSSPINGASMTVFFLFSIYETVLATLAGTHVAPYLSLNCALRERWEALFSAKDADVIRNIQDAFNCCGLKSPQDMAFPFPDATHGADACMLRFERSQSCIEPWRTEERKAAIMLLIVPLAVFAWKLAIFLSSTSTSNASSWLPSTLLPPSSSDSSRRPAEIEYRDVEEQEQDAAAGGGGNDGEADSIYAEITRLNNDSSLASRVEAERSQGSRNGLWREHERWADERD